MSARSVSARSAASAGAGTTTLAPGHALLTRRVGQPLLALLLVLAMLATTLAGTASADTHCDAVPADAAALQSAIDDAESGDVVCLGADTYELTSSLNVHSPGIVIRGASEASTTVDASAVSGYGVDWSANGVTVESLTLVGPDFDIPSAYGFKIAPDGETPLTDATLRNVTVTGSGRSEIDLHNVAGALLDNVTADGTGGYRGVGIGVTNSTGVDIDGAYTTGNSWGGVALFTSDNAGAFGTEQARDIAISNSTFGNDGGPAVYLQDSADTCDSGCAFSDITITGSTFFNPTTHLAQIDASQLPVDLGLDLASIASDPTNHFEGLVVVGPNPSVHLPMVFASIQAGVDVVGILGGGVVGVGPGNYAGGISITTPGITVIGEGDPTVQVASNTTGISVAAANVTVQGLTLVGPHDQPQSENNWVDPIEASTFGMHLRPAADAVLISDNTILDVRSGIQVDSGADVTIADNHIENTKGAILLRNAAVSANGNTEGEHGNEWGIVVLASLPPATAVDIPLLPLQDSAGAYDQAVMDLSEDNGGMTVLDRRFEQANRSHAHVVAGASPTDDEDFDLGNGLGNARQPYGGVGQGLTAVVDGGVVLVAPGDYSAHPVVANRPVSLVGNPGDPTTAGAGEPAPLVGPVTLHGAGSSLQGFEVTSPNGGHGIRITASDMTVSDNTVTDVGVQEGFSGAAQGIYLNPSTDVADIVVERNAISNIGHPNTWSHKGIFAGDSNSDAEIADVTIRDNAISGVSANQAATGGKGAYGITNNVGSGTGASGSMPRLQVTGNTITGLSGRWVHAVGLEGPTPDALVADNVISHLDAGDNPNNDEVGVFFEKNADAPNIQVEGNQFTDMAYGVAIHPALLATLDASDRVDASGNWWGHCSGPTQQVTAGRVAVGPQVDFAPFTRLSSCPGLGSPGPRPTPTPTPPVGGDTTPPPPPKVTPPKPSTPPTPITVPPGQTVQVPRGGATGFVGGQPAPVNKVVVPPPPPPAQRTPAQVQQVQQTANQIVTNLTNTRPSNSTAPAPVTVTQTDTGANINGLLSTPDGQNKPVPAENIVSVSTGDTTVLATGADGEGNSLPLEDDGTINTPQGGSVGTAVGGLTPGSSGQIVAFSDPQQLGTFTADEEGLFRGEIPIPHWLEPGDHTLVVHGQSGQGEVTLAMSITIGASDVFSDVLAGSTHGVAISRLKALGITEGYDDGTYRPAASITRAQMAALLARALRLDIEDATTDLPDVTGAHAGAIAAVLDAGVASGYGDGTFRPEVEVTRGQMASFLANAAGLEPVGESSLLDAVGVHAGAINAVYVSGLANGQTDGMFRPGEPVTRAQMASLVVNLVDHLSEEQAAS